MAVKGFPIRQKFIEQLFRENFRLWNAVGPYDKYHAPSYGIQFDPNIGDCKPPFYAPDEKGLLRQVDPIPGWKRLSLPTLMT